MTSDEAKHLLSLCIYPLYGAGFGAMIFWSVSQKELCAYKVFQSVRPPPVATDTAAACDASVQTDACDEDQAAFLRSLS